MVNKVIEENNISTNLGSGKAFSIANNSNILDILSNKLYENPIEAIVREIFSNAIDANIENKTSGGIEVVLPNNKNMIFQVKDHGIGMDNDKIMNVYCEYGNSTKSNSNDQIGGFGIGCKTPFAYTDTFMLESIKNGVKNSYVIYKTDTDRQINLVSSEPSDGHGTTVTVPVKDNDANRFIRAALKVFLFAKEFPTMDTDSLSAFEYCLKNHYGIEREKYDNVRKQIQDNNEVIEGLNVSSEGLYINIGGVCYSINKDNFRGYRSILNDTYNNMIVLNADVGELSVQASREKLNYDKNTIEIIRRKIKEFIASTVKNIENVLNDNSKTFLERVKVLDMYNLDNLEYMENCFGEY